MKYVILLSCFLFSIVQADSITTLSKKNTQTYVKDVQITWDNNLSLRLNSSGLTTSPGIRIFGSFNLRSEDYRMINLRAKAIKFPKHNILLARKNYTIYILDLKKEKMIGQFNIPSRGTPRILNIQRDNYNFTKIESKFRKLPTSHKGKSFKSKRPGPLILQVMIYKDGKYIHQ